MIEIMPAEVFVKAAVLCLLLCLFARGEADFNFRKVSMATAGLTLGSLPLEGLLKDRPGVFALLPIVILIVLILMRFCWVAWWQALLVALPFVGVSLGLSLVTADLTARSGAAFSRQWRFCAQRHFARAARAHGHHQPGHAGRGRDAGWGAGAADRSGPRDFAPGG